MGDSVKKTTRRGLKAAATFGLSEHKTISKPLTKPLRTGASAARRDAAKQLKEQQQKESLLAAEKESEIAEKRALAQSGRAGRQSLIKSASGGLATTLGG